MDLLLIFQGDEVDKTFFKQSLLERLSDESLAVVSEVLKFEEVRKNPTLLIIFSSNLTTQFLRYDQFTEMSVNYSVATFHYFNDVSETSMVTAVNWGIMIVCQAL